MTNDNFLTSYMNAHLHVHSTQTEKFHLQNYMKF